MTAMPGDISIDEITWLRANSPAWRLLRAENAPLVLSFLHRVFVQGNARAISAVDLETLLDDELYAIRQHAPGSFPKAARAYLDDWARPEAGCASTTRTAPTSRITTPPPPWKRP